MRFKSMWVVGLVVASGCGILGDKDAKKRLTFDTPSAGCLNDFGLQLQSYFKGEIEVRVWEQTWDCVGESLQTFKTYVKPSRPEGYTQGDFRAFAGTFLKTDQPVTAELVQATFELKASLFGGTVQTISLKDLDQVVQWVQWLKKESATLIPLWRSRAEEPSPAHLKSLFYGIRDAGARFAGMLTTGSNPGVSAATLKVLIAELRKLHGFDLREEWVDAGFAMKGLLVGGSDASEIAARDWPQLIRLSSAGGGLLIAAGSLDLGKLKGPNQVGEFYVALVNGLRPIIDAAMLSHGGTIPHARFRAVIDALPSDWLDAKQKIALRDFLNPLSTRLLQGQVAGALDATSVDLMFRLLNRWSRGQTLLETVFERSHLDLEGVSGQAFADAVLRYARDLGPGDGSQSPTDQQILVGLLPLVWHLPPILTGDDPEIQFTPLNRYSLYQLTLTHGIRLGAEQLITAYSTDVGRKRAKLEDLRIFINDITGLGAAFHIMDPTIPKLPERRFQEANLFMPSSNGDDFLDLDEGTEYIVAYLSLSHLATRMVDELQETCPGTVLDAFHVHWMEASCFRTSFASNLHRYWDHMPELKRFYDRLPTSADRNLMLVTLEKAARRYSYSQQPVGRYDIESISGILHYVENLFRRFDVNGDQLFQTSEALTAFPVFRKMIAQFGGLDEQDEGMVKAVFTYMLAKGRQPERSFFGILDLLFWRAGESLWSLETDRMTMFKVVAGLAVPETPPSSGL